MDVYIHVCMCVCARVYVCACACMYVVCVCTYMCVRIYVLVHVWVHVCVHVWVHVCAMYVLQSMVPTLLQAPKTTYQGPAEKEVVEKMRETAKKRAEVGVPHTTCAAWQPCCNGVYCCTSTYAG